MKSLLSQIIKYIPGFRTKKIYKMIIATIYYLFALIMLLTGIPSSFLIFMSLPLVVFGVVWTFTNKNAKNLIVSLLGVALLITGGAMSEQSDNSTNTTVPEPSPIASPIATYTPTSKPTFVPTSNPTLEPTNKPTQIPTEKATTIPVATAHPTNSEASNSNTVWVGDTGKKYHRKDCRTLKGNGHAITLQQALNEGRKPCGVCNP